MKMKKSHNIPLSVPSHCNNIVKTVSPRTAYLKTCKMRHTAHVYRCDILAIGIGVEGYNIHRYYTLHSQGTLTTRLRCYLIKKKFQNIKVSKQHREVLFNKVWDYISLDIQDLMR